MTYASLNAEFRLRVIKTEEVYETAQEFWRERVSHAILHCRPCSITEVHEYSEVLSLLMAKYEKDKLDDQECDE